MKDLDVYVENYEYQRGVMGYATAHCADIFLRHMKNGSVLELGPAEGMMTEKLFPVFEDYTVVEGAKKFVDLIKKRYPKISTVHSYFEAFQPEKKYVVLCQEKVQIKCVPFHCLNKIY
jgi:phospholipid N-methyltransferase